MKTKNKRNYLSQKGITLIALVVTIVVLLILAGVSVNALFGNSGIIEKAKEAQNKMDKATENDKEEIGKLTNWIGDQVNGTTEKTIDEEIITITKENVAKYLGKKVKNYTGATSITINEKSYTVSPTYRLYYVDFDNKYKDGEGTIYLKAECISNYSNYYWLPTDTTSATETNIKIKTLNPSLYTQGITSPKAGNGNMGAVTWLTNTTNWVNLADASMSSNINYIVGSPSLEMMIDSYNTHYGLTGDKPDYSTITEGTRRKLFYRYQDSSTGYQVGPCAGNSAEYSYYTSDNSVCTDSSIDSMYYPGSGYRYWLSSPSDKGEYRVMCVQGRENRVDMLDNSDADYAALCPVVSLKAGVQLQFQ